MYRSSVSFSSFSCLRFWISWFLCYISFWYSLHLVSNSPINKFDSFKILPKFEFSIFRVSIYCQSTPSCAPLSGLFSTYTLFFTFLQFVEKPRVERVSGILAGFELMLMSTERFTSVEKESFSSFVSIASRYGRKGVWSSPSALMHFPRVLRDRFIEFISLRAWPITLLLLTLSEPAKSTN